MEFAAMIANAQAVDDNPREPPVKVPCRDM
jgi:hypothetical protein